MNYIDLRSDTVTKPSKEMREAMANAEVGDDVFGDDTTVNLLQQKCAELTGKESALFVTSGSMANQLAINMHTNPAEEVIVEWDSHVIRYETAGPSVLSGVQLMPLKGNKGVLDVEDIKNNIRPDWYHYPKTSLICLENTHNRSGGTIYPLNDIKNVREVAKKYNLKMHLDGARIFNAVVASGTSLKLYADCFDSISICFSKGLGAPIGSILCGAKDDIKKAHKFRKIIGGGMRQAGIIAAGALYALEHNVERLKDDHRNARHFAEEISNLHEVDIDLSTVQTNLVIFKVRRDAEKLRMDLAEKNVILTNDGPEKIRAVFHKDVSNEQTEHAIEIFRDLMK